MKFINSKNVKNYISEMHQPREWGGLDDYEIKFVPEELENETPKIEDDELVNNNNNSSRANLNLSMENKKVH